MDSLTHIALGAAVGMATMGRRTAPWKAAAWGAVASTLPDLDIFIDHGDPILNMVLHRAETHAPFWLTLFSLPFAAAVARLHGEQDRWPRWWLALWLALLVHPLLDALTVYGTQLGLPFTDRPFGVASVFIIDPLMTLPLLVGTIWLLRRNGRGLAGRRGHAANVAGLVLSAAYLGWGVWAQTHMQSIARQSLAAQGIAAERVLVTPSAFNSVLWRVVAVDGTHYHEGFRSFLDDAPLMHFDRFDRGTALAAQLQGIDGVRRLQAFSHGFWALWETGGPSSTGGTGGAGGTGHSAGSAAGRLGIVDLRMGQEPAYTFRFAVAERHSPVQPLPVAESVGSRPDLRRGLAWLGRRMLGEPLPLPR